MNLRIRASIVSASALLLSSFLGVTPAVAAKNSVPDWEPCRIVDGVEVCPYDDDEPGEYVENFYSGDWGTAGGGGIIVGSDQTQFWDAHIVYKLDQESGDEGVHDVVVQDSRVNDRYNLKMNKWIKYVNSNTALNLTEGDCAAFPEANCISIVDFTYYDQGSNVGGYMQPRGLHARDIAFNPRHMSSGKKTADYTLWHEGGHALGLSHKHGPSGVMSYHRFESSYSPDELGALHLAYGTAGDSGNNGGNNGKGPGSGKGKNSTDRKSSSNEFETPGKPVV